MTEQEEWRPVVGVVGYEVSNLGRCRSVDRWRVFRTKGRSNALYEAKRFFSGRILTPIIGPYIEYSLGHSLRKRAHILVAEAFIGPNPGGLWVLHGDGDATNNRAENLRYGTAAENHADRRRHGRPFTGERNGQAKLSASDVAAIRSDTRLHRVLAEEYGVARSTIGMVKSGANWGHLTDSLGTIGTEQSQ